MVISRLLGLTLRSLQLISAIIVAGIVGHFLGVSDDRGYDSPSRFVYTEVVAALGIVVGILLLIPFTWTLTAFPLDLLMFLLWIISFGLLVDYIAPLNCAWGWSWNPVYPTGDPNAADQCDTWKTALAFIFMAAFFWLCSALLAMWVIMKTRNSRDATIRKRPWYQTHYV